MTEPVTQPGDPEQLDICFETAERYYERSLQTIVVFWDPQARRYRFIYASQYTATDTVEVVRIPK